MVDTFGDGSALGALALDFPGVVMKRGHPIRVVDLGAESGRNRPDIQEPLPQEAQVCTRACLVVVHDSARREAVVDHVGAERDAEP